MPYILQSYGSMLGWNLPIVWTHTVEIMIPMNITPRVVVRGKMAGIAILQRFANHCRVEFGPKRREIPG